jgi:hypothetical protein
MWSDPLRMDHPSKAQEPAVAIRLSIADDRDDETITRLASLSDSAQPHGPVMLAEVDGEPVAALGIADGDAVADPSRANRTILALLHLHRLEARALGAIWAS